jgi:hypothetical protein
MDSKPPECFACDPRARGVRVDLSPQKSVVLPHEHFVYAEFMADEQIDLLKLVFVTHEVILTGYLLRRIETAILNRDLSWLCARQKNFHHQNSDRPFIAKLILRNLEQAKGASEGDSNVSEG